MDNTQIAGQICQIVKDGFQTQNTEVLNKCIAFLAQEKVEPSFGDKLPGLIGSAFNLTIQLDPTTRPENIMTYDNLLEKWERELNNIGALNPKLPRMLKDLNAKIMTETIAFLKS